VSRPQVPLVPGTVSHKFEAMKKRFLSIPLCLFHFAFAEPIHGDLLNARDRVEREAGGLYDGRFEDGTSFQMELGYPRPASPADGSAPELGNAYWYPAHFTGQVISLAAEHRADDRIALSWKGDLGKEEQEKFLIALAPDRLSGVGTWTSAKLGKTMSLKIQRTVLYHSVIVTRPSQEAQANGDKRQFVFSAIFPLLNDPQANDWVRQQAGTCEGDIECANSVKVTWNSGALKSLSAGIWNYNLGTPHGNYYSLIRHYRPEDRNWKELKLSSFIVPSQACQAKVSALIVAKLRAQNLSSAENGALSMRNEPKFKPTPVGISFEFDPYEVGSYAEGAPSVFLTRAQLGGCTKELPTSNRLGL